MDIRKIINDEYPDLIIQSVSNIGSGYDSEAYLINNEYVFKFPKHQIAAANLYKEAMILLEIKDSLPLVPKVSFYKQTNKTNKMDFVGYEKIKGTALDSKKFNSLQPDIKDRLARDIADFLKVLHNLEIKTNIEGLEINKKIKCQKEYDIIKSIALPHFNKTVIEQVESLYSKLLSNNYIYKKVLVHNDFGLDNIFFDDSTNKICGIIDFGDIALYDKDIDFLSLLQNHDSKDFGLKILKYYDHPNIDNVIKKSSFNEFYAQFEYIYLGYEFKINDLLEDSIKQISDNIEGYNENINNTNYYI